MMKLSWQTVRIPWHLATLGARPTTAPQCARGAWAREVHASAFFRSEKQGSEDFNFDDIFSRNKTWVNNQRCERMHMYGICCVNDRAESLIPV
jgi:hypothetical protein